MKCKSCGYGKNQPGQKACNLCGSVLGPSYDSDDAAPDFGYGRGSRSAARGASRQVEAPQVADGLRPTQEQIVYAGDFAIVYAFAHQGGLIVLKPGEVFTFGRGDTADYKIDSKMVSRRHARIHWSGVDPPIPEIVDLDSRNGFTVNGVPTKRKLLDDGDEVLLGNFSATLRVMSANDDLQAQVHTDRLSATTISVQRLFGEVKLISIPALFTHLERIKESGTFTVHHEDNYGCVAFISGVVISAVHRKGEQETLGEDAVRLVARIREGRFSFSPHADVPPQSIGKTVAEMLGPPPGRRRAPPPPTRSRPARGRKPPPPPRRPRH